MNPIAKLDDLFMSRVIEPFAWYCEDRWNFGAPLLARLCNGLYMLAYGAQAVLEGRIASVAVVGLMWIFVWDKILGVRAERETRAYQLYGQNPYRKAWIWRLTMVAIIQTTLVILARYAATFNPAFGGTLEFGAWCALPFTVLELYFQHSNGKPPDYSPKQTEPEGKRVTI